MTWKVFWTAATLTSFVMAVVAAALGLPFWAGPVATGLVSVAFMPKRKV